MTVAARSASRVVRYSGGGPALVAEAEELLGRRSRTAPGASRRSPRSDSTCPRTQQAVLAVPRRPRSRAACRRAGDLGGRSARRSASRSDDVAARRHGCAPVDRGHGSRVRVADRRCDACVRSRRTRGDARRSGAPARSSAQPARRAGRVHVPARRGGLRRSEVHARRGTSRTPRSDRPGSRPSHHAPHRRRVLSRRGRGRSWPLRTRSSSRSPEGAATPRCPRTRSTRSRLPARSSEPSSR